MARRSPYSELFSIEPKKKIRKLHFTESRDILNLPNEILEKIVGNIHFWHRPRLRKSCRRMRSICDSVLMHEFNSALYQYSSRDPKGYEFIALKAIKDATWAYVLNGFESVFCGAMLPLIWNGRKFSPEPDKIKSFLRHFYRLVEAKIADPYSQFSRILYCTTLMGLLKKFRNARLILSTTFPPSCWRIVLELRGPWLGILWSSKSAVEPHERSKLLVILCEILIADLSRRAFKKIWERDSEIFVYGNDATDRINRLKTPTSMFTFKISAPRKIVSLLKSCLMDTEVKWPNRLPKNEFSVLIDIGCREATKWGCCRMYHMEIGPYFETDYSNDGDEFEEGNLECTMSTETVIEIE